MFYMCWIDVMNFPDDDPETVETCTGSDGFEVRRAVRRNIFL